MGGYYMVGNTGNFKADPNCPICNGARWQRNKKDCRYSIQPDGNKLHFCFEEEINFVQGYRCTGTAKNGALMWVAHTGWSFSRVDQDEAERIRQMREEERQQLIATILPHSEKHQAYSRLINNHLGLRQSHKQDLLTNRGLTIEEIEKAKRCNYIVSWESQLNVSGYPANLAGVHSQQWGKQVTVGANGLAIAAQDLDGQILGFQIKPDNDFGAKYIWLSSAKQGGYGPGIARSGEMPLFVWQPEHKDLTQIKEVWYLEGALKSLITHFCLARLQITDVLVVGAAGGNFGENQLKEIVERLPEYTQHFLVPDAGAKANNNLVGERGAYTRLYWNLKNLGCEFQVKWWGQISKEINRDIDELLTETPQLFDTVENLPASKYFPAGSIRKKTEWEKASEHIVLAITWMLSHRKTPWSLVSKTEETRLTNAINNLSGYGVGQMRQTWIDLVKQGQRFIFDSSGTGTGKSYTAGSLFAGVLDADKIIYISKEHRNPTTETLINWPDLESRHDGLVRDQHGKLRRRKADEAYIQKGNCGRTKLLNVLREKNVNNADSAGIICTGCPHFEGCTKGTGQYTFLKDRSDILKRSRFRAHPASLPSMIDFDYAPNPGKYRKKKGEDKLPVRGAVLIWEEWNDILHNAKQLKISLEDVQQLQGVLSMKAPHLAEQLRPITSALASLMDGKQSRFGVGYQDIKAKLPAVDLRDDIIYITIPDESEIRDFTGNHSLGGEIHSIYDVPRKVAEDNTHGEQLYMQFQVELKKTRTYKLDLDAILETIQPNLDALNSTKEYGVDISELPAYLRSKFTEAEDTSANKLNSSLVKQWIEEFLDVLTGHITGYFFINHDTMSLTIPDPYLIHIANAAKANIFLDATATPEKLAMVLGVSTEQITHITQQQEVANLETDDPLSHVSFIQVTGLGRLGASRGPNQIRRVKAVVEALKSQYGNAAIIDLKKFNTEGDLNWWVESRGTNDIYEKGIKTLVLIGTPCRPIEQLASEFTLLYGRAPKPGMEEFTRTIQTKFSGEDAVQFTGQESIDPEFREFVYQDINSTILQGIGRLRAQRRTDEQLQVYLIGDFPYSFPVDYQTDAVYISPDAASKSQSLEIALVQAIDKLKDLKQKLTLDAVSKLVGKSIGRLTQFAQELGWGGGKALLKFLVSLVTTTNKTKKTSESNSLNTTSQDNLDQSQLTPEESHLVTQYLPLAYKENPETIGECAYQAILKLSKSIGKGSLNRMLHGLSEELRQNILAQLLWLLPEQHLEQLEQLLPG